MSERNRRTATSEATESEDETQGETEQEDGSGKPERAPSAFLPEPEEQTKEALPEARKGERVLIYQGSADAVRHGEHTFRPGQPVAVPSEVAEELLTLPFESFIDAHEVQKAKE